MRSKGLATIEPSKEIVVHGHKSRRKQASVMKPNLEEARLLRSNDCELLKSSLFFYCKETTWSRKLIKKGIYWDSCLQRVRLHGNHSEEHGSDKHGIWAVPEIFSRVRWRLFIPRPPIWWPNEVANSLSLYIQSLLDASTYNKGSSIYVEPNKSTPKTYMKYLEGKH